MERVRIDGAELEVESHGDGEPVLLVHGSNISSAFVPMLGEQALAGYRLIRYNRRGHGRSSPAPAGFSVEDQAADAASLLRSLGAVPAHVVGHSYGGPIATQLALDAPELVHSLALLEPPLPGLPGQLEFDRLVAPIGERFRRGDRVGAYDELLLATGGPHYRLVLDTLLPGAYEQAVADLDCYFAAEQASVAAWRFTRDEAARLTQPVLLVLGTKTTGWFVEGNELLRRWLPHAATAEIPGASHLLEITHPRAVAETLGAFFAAHPRA